MQFRFRPLRWDGPSTPARSRRSRSTFKASYSDTLALLRSELKHLGAKEVVIEADFREQDIRLDGLPRSNARVPQHPGVRIFFESRHGSLMYATDSCERWEHNLRSIALGLEALRAVDRYGITRRGEQYTGWKAIGSPGRDEPSDPWLVVADLAGVTVPVAHQDPPAAYRAAARAAHPDTGGSDAQFQALQTAWAAIQKDA